MARSKLPQIAEQTVLTKSLRRCALCFGLNQDSTQKRGQIAHLNKNKNDNRVENLAFLCFDHHDTFDSTTSQSKNYTCNEIKHHRDQLYNQNQTYSYDPQEIKRVIDYLSLMPEMFEKLRIEGGEIAYCLDSDLQIELEFYNYNVSSNNLLSFSKDIYDIQMQIASNISEIQREIDLSEYHLAGNNFIFTWREDQSHNEKLEFRKETVRNLITEIIEMREMLRAMVTN
ncbi:hypothetical protein FY550_11400 [Kushneria phosphatilytica]|uniref:Uncharacterized protein n=1 Tax=Kushneria phosphatilytica TaxID=657387 RepID=A0A5C0ZYS1_9GAMM|nr:hypothetical protein [Kushneria phosphatilytica]QEL11682.1 hypothetical protein FY550_11400 [Kushneria phosphatilytica]